MATNTSIPRIVHLAAIIGDSVTKIHEVLSAQNVPTPSFDEDTPTSLPKEVSDAQDAVLDATAELFDLLLEPLTLVYKYHGHNNSVCLQAIARFSIASIVPFGGQISFADIAKETGLSEQIVVRLIRHAMTMRIFREPEPGIVAHTQASKMLASPVINDWLKVGSEEMWPAAVKMPYKKWPGSAEPNETGFSLANNTTESIYTIIGSSPERASRFSNAMEVFAARPEYDPLYIIDNYDWASLGPTQVVDVGGAQGHIAMSLARRFENLNILVQDMDKVVEKAELGVPEELKGRVRFMAHDFFAPQTIQADIFFFRWILHNWSDKYCILILRAQIPVLKRGTRLIIQESCMPEPGAVALWKEKDLRAEDLNMGAVFNSRERTVNEWAVLLKDADPRFVLKGVTEPKGSALGIIEVIWDGVD
ncbi:hypothetical protein G7Y89_g4831 [Cudoniella acicularis]|uniref:O-methyltransferase domain-containing protein n=1 Tax=Cudoniella acicularis TaxID=354080 RepID=A0A8H4RPG9_9HELO|nr:hypothetical protein G7Y89_g4831 [Cudoniella acicularis]